MEEPLQQILEEFEADERREPRLLHLIAVALFIFLIGFTVRNWYLNDGRPGFDEIFANSTKSAVLVFFFALFMMMVVGFIRKRPLAWSLFAAYAIIVTGISGYRLFIQMKIGYAIEYTSILVMTALISLVFLVFLMPMRRMFGVTANRMVYTLILSIGLLAISLYSALSA